MIRDNLDELMMINTEKIKSIQTKNTVTLLQINIAGLSDNSKIGLDKYANELKADVVAVAETKKDIAVDLSSYGTPFIAKTLEVNDKTRSGGTALYITENATGTAQIKELESKTFSSVWVLCIIKNASYLIASVYVPHNSPKAMEEFLKSVENACEFCKRNSVKYMNILGDFNSRHTAWDDTVTNTHGNMLADFVNENDDTYIASPGDATFICKGGSSKIDLLLCNKSTTDNIKVQVVDDVYHLGSGAPSRGHLPVITVVKTREEGKSAPKKSVLDFKRADWDLWTESAEEMCHKNTEDLSNATTADELWQIIGKTISEANEKAIPRKTVCKYSKPFWNDDLSAASLKVKYASKLYHRNSSYINSTLVAIAKQEYSDKLTQSINEWMEEKAGDLNNSKMIPFWAKYKKYLCNTRKRSKVEIIKNNGNFIMAYIYIYIFSNTLA